MTHDTEKGFYIGLMVALGFVAFFCTMAGCATTRQSVEVTAVYSGERPEVQACYKVNMP